MNKPADNQNNFDSCICPNCSLFTDCNKEKSEKFFCGRKKSGCEMDPEKMCICGMCPVYTRNNLSGGYFCINEIGE
jgi:aldose sugar dehydrogenase